MKYSKGIWFAENGSRGVEFFSIYDNGVDVIAIKLAGDGNAPAGSEAWRVSSCIWEEGMINSTL